MKTKTKTTKNTHAEQFKYYPFGKSVPNLTKGKIDNTNTFIGR